MKIPETAFISEDTFKIPLIRTTGASCLQNEQLERISGTCDEWSESGRRWFKTLTSDQQNRTRGIQPRLTWFRLGFPLNLNGEYAVVGSERYMRFAIEYYKLVAKNFGVYDSRILGCTNIPYPFFLDFVPTDKYKVKEVYKYPEEVLRLHIKVLRSFPEDIKVRCKKSTTPGFPFQTAKGEQLKSDMVSVTLDPNKIKAVKGLSEHDKNILSRVVYDQLFKDYSNVKRDFLAKMRAFQLRLNNNSAEWLESHLFDSLLSNLFPVNTTGFRMNQVDRAPNVEELRDKLTLSNFPNPQQKVRGVSIATSGTTALTHDLHPELLVREIKSITGLPGLAVRSRAINNHGVITSPGFQAAGLWFLSGIEESEYGFLSEQESVVQRYKSFLVSTEGKRRTFIDGDVKNCDQVVSTNFETLLLCFPSSLRDWVRKSIFQCKMSASHPVITHLQASGHGMTTVVNYFYVLFQYVYPVLAKLVGENHDTVAKAHLSSLEKREPFFSIKGCDIFLPLTTDNISAVVAGEVETISQSYLNQLKEDRYFSLDVNSSGFTSFGMDVDSKGMQVSQASNAYKVFFYEKITNPIYDGFKLYSRLELMESSVRLEVLKLVKRFYPTFDLSQRIPDMFLAMLTALGLSPEDVFMREIPHEAKMLRFIEQAVKTGRLSPPDYATSSQLYGDEYYNLTVGHLNSLYGG